MTNAHTAQITEDTRHLIKHFLHKTELLLKLCSEQHFVAGTGGWEGGRGRGWADKNIAPETFSEEQLLDPTTFGATSNRTRTHRRQEPALCHSLGGRGHAQRLCRTIKNSFRLSTYKQYPPRTLYSTETARSATSVNSDVLISSNFCMLCKSTNFF